MSKTTYDVVEPVASDWLETRDPVQDLLPINPCCLFTHEDAYNKSIPSRTPSLQCKCAYCGKIFLIDKHTAQDIIVKKSHRIYCSRVCSNKSKVKRHQPYICKNCGKMVSSDDYFGSGQFCSRFCANSHNGKLGNTPKAKEQKRKKLLKNPDYHKQTQKKPKKENKQYLSIKIYLNQNLSMKLFLML